MALVCAPFVAGVLAPIAAAAADGAPAVAPASDSSAAASDAGAGEAEQSGAADPTLVVVESGPDGVEISTFEPETALEAAAITADARNRENFVAVEVDSPVQAMGEPLRPQQWALDQVAFEAVWPTANGAGVTVAVVDSGVYAGHEDLGAVVLPGKDYVGGTDGRSDPGGHGTMVAGIISASLNGRGIAGAAPAARILPVRVLAADGSGYMSDVAKGITWAVDNGADIVTMSLGGTTPSTSVLEAIRYARSEGVPVFAAAGNNAQSGNAEVYPAAFAEAVAVASVNSSLGHSAFSSFHDYVDIAAPGESIVSASHSGPTGYATGSGTSMATPFAAAAAAIVVQANPGLDASGIEQALFSTARDLGQPGRDPYFGNGLVDVAAATTTATGGSFVGAPTASNPAPHPTGPGDGYWVVSSDGRVRAYGDAGHYGDLGTTGVVANVVAATPTATGNGYWLAGTDGRVYAFGDAAHHGDMGAVPLNAGIVGMAVTPDGGGYYLLGADGGIFSFGDAPFFGSTGGMVLNAPVLDMTVTASGDGYWLVAADGGIFAFGDAGFKGSTGGLVLNEPVRSMTASSTGDGYWLVARDGGIFAFGVPFHGSLPGLGVGDADGMRIRALPDGSGYYILTVSGDVYALGSAPQLQAAAPQSIGAPAVDLMLVP